MPGRILVEVAKYYTENRMGSIRERLEKEVLGWPRVSTKRMFGCPSYLTDGRLFALVVDGGIVLTSMSEQDLEKLKLQHKVEPFRAGGRTIARWALLALEAEEDVTQLIPWVRRSYASAAGE